MEIGVVTDSGCDLPRSALDVEHAICVPLDVRLGATEPVELQTLSNDAFWTLMKTASDLPATAAPSPGAFIDAYRCLQQQGCTGIVCITLSSELSATFQAATLAAGQVADGLAVTVIDSRNATIGEGLLVLEAIAMRERLSDLTALVAHLETTRDQIATFGTLDTLDNLHRGGRIGGAQAFFGTLLSIKPIIEVRDGRIEGTDRQRTRARSLAHLAAMARAAGPLARIAVVHAAATDIEEFLVLLDDIDSDEKLFVATMGPVIGTHTGLGTIGVALLPKESPLRI